MTGPLGIKIAAVAGAITQTVALTAETTSAPPEALLEGATPVGEYLRISSAQNRLVDIDTPFVIGIPVATGVDTTHLALAQLLPASYTLDTEASGNLWEYVPGVYDAASGLFLTQMPFLRTPKELPDP